MPFCIFYFQTCFKINYKSYKFLLLIVIITIIIIIVTINVFIISVIIAFITLHFSSSVIIFVIHLSTFYYNYSYNRDYCNHYH